MAKTSDAKVTVQPSDNERLIEAVEALTTKVDELQYLIEDLAEKVSDLTVAGTGYGYDETTV